MSESPARFTLITGPRDAGKTATMTRLAAEKRREGARVGGVIAQAHLRDGVKVAYSFRDLATDDLCLYAEAREEGSPGYRFLPDGLAFGCDAVRRALQRGVDVLFVDEWGPLEMSGAGLFEPLREACAAEGTRLYLTVRPSLLRACMSRLCMSEGEVFVMTLPPRA